MSVERERPFLKDPDDIEYIKDLRRPAVIKEDLSEMERRKRVQQVLESKEFLKELEKVKFMIILQETEVSKSDLEQLKLVQKLSEFAASNPTGSLAKLRVQGSTPQPVADLRENEDYSRADKNQRNKLASACRLIDAFDCCQGLKNSITARLPSSENEYLINPYGLLLQEVTASSLIKAALEGEIVDPGSSRGAVNESIFRLHSQVYRECESVRCIVQLQVAVVAAVASMQCGLLNICQEAMTLGPVKCIDYIEDDDESIISVAQHFTEANVVLLRNRGLIIAGKSIEEVIWLTYQTVVACETQIRAIRAGLTNLVIPDEHIVRKTYIASRTPAPIISSPGRGDSSMRWKTEDLEFEAWMRMLDHAGFRTGHIYRINQLRPQSQMSSSYHSNIDVAEPPSLSSYGTLDDSFADSIVQKLAQMRSERARWLNSPNAYQKIEVLETGTDRPKVITKWVQDLRSQSLNGTPIKISSPHQFSPVSANPKEFRDQQRKIKENRLSGAKSAGPQSQILEGVSFDEIAQMRLSLDESALTDRAVLIGTASKGIIDRQHQHNAQVYRQLYAPNPFSLETDEGIHKYMDEIQQKSQSARSPNGATDNLSQIPPLPLDEDITHASTSMYDLDGDLTSLDVSHEPVATSTPIRDIHENGRKQHDSSLPSTSQVSTQEKKKKKRGFFSFMKKKDPSTTI